MCKLHNTAQHDTMNLNMLLCFCSSCCAALR